MTAGEARAVLASMADAYNVPELRADELDACLLRARRADAAGLGPEAPGYSGAYDFAYAALSAWRLKAGKAAKFHGHTTQGRNFDAGAVYDHCMKMVEDYRRSVNATVPICANPTTPPWP